MRPSRLPRALRSLGLGMTVLGSLALLLARLLLEEFRRGGQK
jgi:hypothetical protein